MVLRPAYYFSIFVAVFYNPDKACRLAGNPRSGSWPLFLFYGLPLILTGSLGRMLILGEGKDLSLASLVVFWINLAAYVLAILLGSGLVARLARPFKAVSDRGLTLKLMVVAFTPFFLSQLMIALIPGIKPVGFLALGYTVFLFGKGLVPLLETPPAKVAGFTLVAFFILLGIAWVVNILLSGLLIFVL
jgi:hypothetical protein